MDSLGFIETMGYVPAFQVADTMAKAADVEIVKKVWVGAGLVTIVIKGEISAIHTAPPTRQAAWKPALRSRILPRAWSG